MRVWRRAFFSSGDTSGMVRFSWAWAEFFRNEGRHGRQVEYGEGHEIPVIDRRDSHRRVDSTDGLGRNTRQEDVRRDDEDVGRKSRIDGGQGTGEAD